MSPYPLQIDDAGCHLSLRPHERHDCTVRTFSIVTQLPYDHIFDVFTEAGRQPHSGFESDKWLTKRRGKVLGGRFKKVAVGRDSTPLAFAHAHYVGRYVVETVDHCFALVDGVYRDLLRLKPDESLTGAWLWIPPS